MVAGVYLSKIQFLQTEWLSRAGCLIVILGIGSGLGVIIHERLLLIRFRWRRRMALAKAKKNQLRKAIPEEEFKQSIEQINNTFDKKMADMTQKLKLSFGIVEVSLLISGTFIWGFGDLLVRLLFGEINL